MAQAEQRWFGNRMYIGGSVWLGSGPMEYPQDIAYEMGSVGVGSIYFTMAGSGQGIRILSTDVTDDGWHKLEITD